MLIVQSVPLRRGRINRPSFLKTFLVLVKDLKCIFWIFFVVLVSLNYNHDKQVQHDKHGDSHKGPKVYRSYNNSRFLSAIVHYYMSVFSCRHPHQSDHRHSEIFEVSVIINHFSLFYSIKNKGSQD